MADNEHWGEVQEMLKKYFRKQSTRMRQARTLPIIRCIDRNRETYWEWPIELIKERFQVTY